ncbi:MAG: choice-of-anchor D domain-containing protein, partial [Terriglobales bacterium]
VFYPIYSGPDQVALFLGNGDGTLQNPLSFTSLYTVSAGLGFGMGDFNGYGLLDLVTNDGTLYLQVPATASPLSLEFGDQTVGTASTPQTVTVTNLQPSALKIKSIGIGGANYNDFSETNKCGTSLPAHGSCQVQVTFSPQATGDLYASLNVNYQGSGGSLSVPLNGTGVTTTVTLTPPSLRFPTQLIGTASAPQAATLINTGTGPVTISSISTKGLFTQTNDCLASLPAGSNCDIYVRFAPRVKGPAKGTLSVSDDATGSPQTVSLSGVGTVVTFSPEGVNFGDQKVGTSSPPVAIELFNKGGTTLSITQITIGGTNSGDFAQKNNCGQSVPARGHCTMTVTFKPTATGQRSASVSVIDNGGGSPQSVPLAGTGT